MSETKIVRIGTDAPYDVKIGEDLLSKAGKTVAALCNKCERVALVSDDRVYPLYGGEVTRSLQKAGFEVLPFVFQNGEESKTTDTLVRLLNFLAENGLSNISTGAQGKIRYAAAERITEQKNRGSDGPRTQSKPPNKINQTDLLNRKEEHKWQTTTAGAKATKKRALILLRAIAPLN